MPQISPSEDIRSVTDLKRSTREILDLYANFAGYGLYQWDGSAWTQINPTVPTSMAASGSTLYANFTGLGLYTWNGSSWSRIRNVVAADMWASGSILYANFAEDDGIYMWDGCTWSQINPAVPTSVVVGF